MRIAEEHAVAARVAHEAAQRELSAHRAVRQLQKAVKAKDGELKLAVGKAARMAQEKAAAEARALAAEQEAQSIRELYKAAGASEGVLTLMKPKERLMPNGTALRLSDWG